MTHLPMRQDGHPVFSVCILPDGNGGAPPAGRGEPARVELHVKVGAQKGDLFAPYVEGAATEVFAQGSEAMNRDMPDRVMQIINDERAR